MADSKLLTLSADGATAAVSTPEISDIVTTVFSTNKVLTGMYGLGQRAALVVVGMSAQEYRRTGRLNPFAAA